MTAEDLIGRARQVAEDVAQRLGLPGAQRAFWGPSQVDLFAPADEPGPWRYEEQREVAGLVYASLVREEPGRCHRVLVPVEELPAWPVAWTPQQVRVFERPTIRQTTVQPRTGAAVGQGRPLLLRSR